MTLPTHIEVPRGSRRLLALGIFTLSAVYVLSAAVPTIKHTMLISGTGLNYVGIVDTTGAIAWKYDEVESAAGNGQKNDCWLLPNGNVVYSYQWGVRIVDVRTKQKIWERPTPKRNNQSGETHSCQPLEGGSRFLIPECFPDTAFIVEVDTAKRELRRIGLRNQGGGTHGKWRQIRKTPQNTYLVSSYDLGRSFEYDTAGKLLKEFPAGGYVATRLENGNTLIGTGDRASVVEFNAAGTNVWEVNNTTATVSGLGIGFASEAQRLPNGNTILTNWGGHGTGFGQAVVEVKPDRTVVGALSSTFPTNIASVKIIDAWKFPVRQYTITAAAAANGTITPSGAVLVDSAMNKTFSIAANTGYTIDSVKVDGVGVGAVSIYTFTTVKATHTISVTFKAAVGVDKTVPEKFLAAGDVILIENAERISCAVPFSGTTVAALLDCSGRMVQRQTISGPGTCTLGGGLIRGVYVFSLKNYSEKKTWTRTVVVK